MLQHAMGEPQVPGAAAARARRDDPGRARLPAADEHRGDRSRPRRPRRSSPACASTTTIRRSTTRPSRSARSTARRRPSGSSRERGWVVGEDSGRGWRCMVASPQAGRDPRARGDQGARRERRDRHRRRRRRHPRQHARRHARRAWRRSSTRTARSAELGIALGFDILVLLTAVPRVVEDFGTRWERPLFRMSASETQRPAGRRRVSARQHGPEGRVRRSASRPAAGAPRSSPTPRRCWPRSAARTAPGSRPSQEAALL